MLILGERDVRDLLTYPECIERMDEVLRSLAEGDVLQPARSTLALPGGERLLGMMPGYLGGTPPTVGLKAIAVVPSNRESGRPALVVSPALPESSSSRAKRERTRTARAVSLGRRESGP